MQTFQPKLFIPAMLIGTACVYHFVLLSFRLYFRQPGPTGGAQPPGPPRPPGPGMMGPPGIRPGAMPPSNQPGPPTSQVESVVEICLSV